MSAQRLPFQVYLASSMLARLTWKRRYFKLFGSRVMAAGPVVAEFKASFLLAAALGQARPDVVRPILEASSRPGGDPYTFGLLRAHQLMDAAQGHPKSYEDLFPDDARLSRDSDSWSGRKVLPFDFSFMLLQSRVVEGLAFGEQYPRRRGRC